MTMKVLTRSVYSPGNLTSRALERLFVGRQKLLRNILRRLARSATHDEKHFILLIGPRGIGKTTTARIIARGLTPVVELGLILDRLPSERLFGDDAADDGLTVR